MLPMNANMNKVGCGYAQCSDEDANVRNVNVRNCKVAKSNFTYRNFNAL